MCIYIFLEILQIEIEKNCVCRGNFSISSMPQFAEVFKIFLRVSV